MKLAKYLANLGYGSRRECEWLLQQRRVRHRDGTVLRDGADVAHGDIRVDGDPLDPPAGSVIALHKPEGFVCSTRDVPPLIYELLPSRFRFRSPLMAAVGRLDRETSGLLLLTDDGALNHRLTSPRSHVTKTYEVMLAEELSAEVEALFASGTLMLDGETEPLAPAQLETLDARRARIVITEGRYHQVRRMFAAAGNHVVALKRTAIGGLSLGDTPPGAWHPLRAEALSALFATTVAERPAP